MAAQREWFEKDYYKVLGVSETATAKEITRAYRKLARQYHPDTNPGNAEAEERFKDISAAYDVVGDEAKRKEYDEVRALGPMAAGFGPGPGGPGPGGGFTFTETGDLNDLLSGLLGRTRRGRGGAAGPTDRGPGPQRGADLEADLTLSFEDAVSGLTTALHLTSDAACPTCNGTGAKPGTLPKACGNCGGRGVTADNQGLFSFSQTCRVCRGEGFIVEHPCETCRGTGVTKKDREVKVRIPSGVEDGQRIRLKGRGGPGRNGGPAGDLYVTTRVQPHAFFGRKGHNLTIKVPVTFAEAALGADIEVPTLDEGPVKVRIPAGTPSGRTLRVKGKGVPVPKGPGDLLVTVDVAVPTHLSAAERKAVEDLAKATRTSPRAHLGVS